MSVPVRYSDVVVAAAVAAGGATGSALSAAVSAAQAHAIGSHQQIQSQALCGGAEQQMNAGANGGNHHHHQAMVVVATSSGVAAAASGAAAAAAAAADDAVTVEQWQRRCAEVQQEGRLSMPDAAGAGSSSSSSNNNNHPHAMNMDMHTNDEHEYVDEDEEDDYEEDDGQDRVQQHMMRKAMEAAAAAAEQRPTPSPEQLFAQLHEALALESKYQAALVLPKESMTGEITCGTRDGAAQVLRCLKMWYDLPSDVLFTAINLVDRFLTKMKVKPKHIACISVGSFLLAVQQLGLPKMDTEDLVTISQCRCSASDLERMASIIANKLGVQIGSQPVTSLACLRIIYYIIRDAAHKMGCGQFFDQALQLHELEMQLEILACDAELSNLRATEMALVLVCAQLDMAIAKVGGLSADLQCLVDYAIEMQNLCRVSETVLFENFHIVVRILSRYNGQHKMPYRQRLVWKLSSRTMRVLRPTDKLTSHLPTIAEHNVSNNNAAAGFACRFRTGSVSSEEGEEDWPSSPVVPVYEQC